jgi:hypothetical protein
MIEPYYSDSLVTLYHGDCREVQAWLTADVLVTDPPYGIPGGRVGQHQGHLTAERDAKWDDLATRDEVLALWGDKPYAVFGSPKRLDARLPHVEAPIVWDKGDSPGLGRIDWPFGVSYELAYINGNGWGGRRRGSVIRVGHNSSVAAVVGHPTPKPIALMEQIIARAPQGIIADPFAGAGSTLVAAKNLKRRAIGIEIEERYCEIAAERCRQEVLDFGGAA